MKNIVPHHVVSDSIHIEQSPVGFGLTLTYRGVEWVTTTHAQGDVSPFEVAQPYRMRLPQTVKREPIPVIVRIMPYAKGSSGASYGAPSYGEKFFEIASVSRRRLQAVGAPCILHTLGVGAKLLATVEEYLVGTPVRAMVKEVYAQGKTISEPDVLALGAGLLSFLQMAVAKGSHVSVDLDSLLVDDRGRLRIRARYREEESRQIVGAALIAFNQNFAVVSPEEVRGGPLTDKSPMFTFGLVLYEMLTGIHPFRVDDNLFATMMAIEKTSAPFLRSKRPDVHPVVAAFVHRCLAREPGSRFPNWNELRAAYSGMQALFAPVTPEEIADVALRVVPTHDARSLPFVMPAETLSEYGPNRLQPVQIAPLDATKRASLPTVIPKPPAVDSEAEFAGYDGRPMFRVSPTLFVDARPVTKSEMERYFFSKRQPSPPLLQAIEARGDDEPCVYVTAQMAEDYAAWAGKRLPTELEWEMAARHLGAERLDMGRIWEWTSTPGPGRGHIVRGGRWRDQPALGAHVDNRSYETNPAPDVGFRCVVSLPDET